MDGIIAIAQSNGQGMSNTLVGDFIAHTCDPLQSIMLGACNDVAAVYAYGGSNLQLNGTTGVNKAPAAPYAIDVAGTTNVSTLCINGTTVINSAGSYALVATLPTAGVTSVTFSNLSNDRYELVVPNIVPGTNGGTLRLLASSNNGSTFFATGYNGYHSSDTFAAPSTFTGTSNTTYAQLAFAASSNPTMGGAGGNYMMYNCGTSNSFRVRGQYGTVASATTFNMGLCMAVCSSAVNSVNAVQLSWLEGYPCAAYSAPVSVFTHKY